MISQLTEIQITAQSFVPYFNALVQRGVKYLEANNPSIVSAINLLLNIGLELHEIEFINSVYTVDT